MSDAGELRDSIARVLRQRPSITARELVRALTASGHEADRSRVNSLLYRHPELFHRDDDVPPNWSLADTDRKDASRTPHRVCGLRLENWKAFEDVTATFAGVTLLYGENSAGKSSLFQALLLMKQSWGHGYLQLDGPMRSFGWYEHVVHQHDLSRDISIAAFWGEPSSTSPWGLMLEVPHGDPDFAYNSEHQIGRILCLSPDGDVVLVRPAAVADWSQLTGHEDVWMAVRVMQDELVSSPEGIGDRALAFRSDGKGFPDVDQFLDAPATDTPRRRAHAKSLETIRHVLRGAGAMLGSIEYIGPARAIPQRDIRLSWAREHSEYLSRLFENRDLVLDVNEWLARFDIPYAIEIAWYGDDDGDEVFELDLHRRGDAGEKVQLHDVGFGVSQLLPIIVQLLGSREKTILIEEPEAHIHPRLQSVLADLFVTSMQDYGNVLMVETHSEPILLRLQRRVAEGRIDRDDLAVLHVIRQGRSSEVDVVPIQANGQLDNYQWPGGFFDDRMDDLVAILDPRPEA